MLFYIKKKTSSKITIFNLTVQNLEEASSAVPQLARGRRVNRQEEGLAGGGGGWETAELKGGRRWGRVVRAVSLTPARMTQVLLPCWLQFCLPS